MKAGNRNYRRMWRRDEGDSNTVLVVDFVVRMEGDTGGNYCYSPQQ